MCAKERPRERVQPVRDEEGVERGKDLGVGHGERIRTHLRARDGDALYVRAVRREDDVVRRDEEDGTRGSVSRTVRLHGWDDGMRERRIPDGTG